MTSNTGSQHIQDGFMEAEESGLSLNAQSVKMKVMEEVKRSFRPEFLNRVDEIIMFTPLNRNEIREIVELQLSRLGKRLEDAQINLRVTKDTLSYLSEEGYDPQYGARPVKRVIQKEVLNELSKAILGNQIDKSEPVVMDVFDGQVVFRKEIEQEELLEV